MRLATMVARFTPARLGYFFAAVYGNAVFLFSARRRNIVANNIEHIIGLDPDKKSQRRKVRSVFINIAKNYIDLTKLSKLRFENLEESVSIEGWHHLAKALTDKSGVIIASAHLGNFEFLAQVLVLRGLNMSIFVEPFDSTPFLRCIAKLRQGNGARMLPVGTGALRESLQVLRRGGTIGIVCDRDIQGNGLKVNFFGEEASLPLGAVNLALRTGAAIIPIFSVRKSGNRFAIYVEPPLRLVDTGNRGHSVRANLEKLVAVMERYIRQYPEQLAVLEPIWRNRAAEVDSTR